MDTESPSGLPGPSLQTSVEDHSYVHNQRSAGYKKRRASKDNSTRNLTSHSSINRIMPPPPPPPPQPHFLLLTFPVQSHINPPLQLAKLLARTGAHVTFATSVHAINRITSSSSSTPAYPNLTYASFSDGYDEGVKPTDDVSVFLSQFHHLGSVNAARLARSLAAQGRPVTCVVYTILLFWAAEIAHQLRIPSFLLWIQPAALFSIYYHHFHGYSDQIIASLCRADSSDPSSVSPIALPGLPPLAPQDIPSFLHPTNPYQSIATALSDLFGTLRKQEGKPRVLMNTFEALECGILKAVAGKTEALAIGPLIPSAFLDRTDELDTSFGADLFAGSSREKYIQWLDSKEAGSVIYISFGSVSVLPRRQMEEILKGLIETGRSFMWVIRKSEKKEEEAEMQEFRRRVSQESEKQGAMVVGWCSQVQVLGHPSVGCFVTHCGWNSTSEALASGVPMVGLPQWTDQPMNAKLVQDVWKAGVKARANGEGVVEAGELRRCLEVAMGREVRESARRWRELAREAAGAGGSSDRNIRAFVEEMKGRAAGTGEADSLSSSPLDCGAER